MKKVSNDCKKTKKRKIKKDNQIKNEKVDIKEKKISKLLIIISIIITVLIVSFIISIGYINKQVTKMSKLATEYTKKEKLYKELGSVKTKKKFSINKNYYIKYPHFKYDVLNDQVDKIVNSIIKKDCNKKIGSSFDEIFHNKVTYCIVDYESYLAPDGIVGISFVSSKLNNKKKVLKQNAYTINLHVNEQDLLNNNYIFVGDYNDAITKYLDNYLNNNENIKSKLNKKYKNIINNKNKYKYVLTNNSMLLYFNSTEILKNSSEILKISIPYNDLKDVLNIDINNIIKLKDISFKKEKFNDNKKEMYIKRISNIYKKSSKNSKLLGTIVKGKKIILLKSSDNFSIINYEDKNGYILNSNLSDDIIADEGYVDNVEIVYASEEVSVRKGTDDSSEELVHLALGDSITRIGTSDDGWSQVVHNNEKGFVKSNFLSLTKPITNRYVNIDKNKNINVHGGMVALTFDDGPNPSSTGRILDILQKNNAVATFFDLGKLVLAYPDTVKREEAIGCEVGSHTFDHANLNNLSAEAIQSQVNSSKNAFISVLGHDVGLLRPPYGNANDLVKANIPYPVINWNVDTLDWKSKNKDAIINEVRKIGNLDGKIILMHSIYETTADAVEVIVPELISQGYQLVTISEMAYYKGVTLTPGVKYFGF